jgi:prepilin-type processing-associated H-X9-DG protein
MTRPPPCFQAEGQYGIHSRRFNYLFHDNHVQALRMEDTVGTGTMTSPRGMWTHFPGD